jgi:hypothetical protein
LHPLFCPFSKKSIPLHFKETFEKKKTRKFVFDKSFLPKQSYITQNIIVHFITISGIALLGDATVIKSKKVTLILYMP